MVKVTKERFEGEVLGAETPVLADFHADWCGPCRALRPVLEELEAAEAGVKFVSVNVDEERELAGEYGIASIPCLLLFRNGAEAGRLTGLRSREELEALLEEA
jgi:thioredoxin 1